MPFIQQDGRPFKATEILDLVPDQMGVYGILNSERWIYVGKGDIRARLLDHLGGGNPCIINQGPTHFVAEVRADMDRREKELILELSPCCNRRVG